MKKAVKVEERLECERCEGIAILVKVFDTGRAKQGKKEKPENLIYIEDALILVYECEKCDNSFARIVRKR